MYVCMNVCMYICMYVFVYISGFIYIYKFIHHYSLPYIYKALYTGDTTNDICMGSYIFLYNYNALVRDMILLHLRDLSNVVSNLKDLTCIPNLQD